MLIANTTYQFILSNHISDVYVSKKNSKVTSYQFILATVMLVLVIMASPYQFILSNHSDQVDVAVQLQDRGIVFTPSIKALQDKDDKDI